MTEMEASSNTAPIKKRRRNRRSKKTINATNSAPSTNVTGATNNKPPKKQSKKRKKKVTSKKSLNAGPPSTANHQLHLPHYKIVLKNITNIEKYGSYSKLSSFVKTFVQEWNDQTHSQGTTGNNDQKGEEGEINTTNPMVMDLLYGEKKSFIPIMLDESFEQRMLKLDKQHEQPKVNLTSENEGVKEEASLNNDVSQAEVKGGEESKTKCTEEMNCDQDQLSSGLKTLNLNESNPEHNTEIQQDPDLTSHKKRPEYNLLVKVLYMVLPHKSRRRGEISGRIYLTLHPPTPLFILDKLYPHMPSSITTTKNIGDEIIKASKINYENKPEKDEEKLNTTTEATETVPFNDGVNPDVGSVTKSITTPSNQNDIIITPAERSKALAQSRLLIQETIKSFDRFLNKKFGNSNLNIINNKNSMVGAGSGSGMMKIELCMNQKTWKVSDHDVMSGGFQHRHTFRWSRYENTIEKNEDFKEFMERKALIEEERANRPKPPPGGGLASSSDLNVEKSGGNTGIDGVKGASDSNNLGPTKMVDENGLPISAIVAHLMETKAAKRRAKESKKKANMLAASILKGSQKQKKSKKGGGGGGGIPSSGGGRRRKSKKPSTSATASSVNASPSRMGSKKSQKNKSTSERPVTILTKPSATN